MARIRMPLPDEHCQFVDQSFFLEKPFNERRQWFIYPAYMYDEPMAPTDPTLKGSPRCWVIKGELSKWFRSLGLTPDDVIIDMETRSKGWVVWLPKHIATMYKLTWL